MLLILVLSVLTSTVPVTSLFVHYFDTNWRRKNRPIAPLRFPNRIFHLQCGGIRSRDEIQRPRHVTVSRCESKVQRPQDTMAYRRSAVDAGSLWMSLRSQRSQPEVYWADEGLCFVTDGSDVLSLAEEFHRTIMILWDSCIQQKLNHTVAADFHSAVSQHWSGLGAVNRPSRRNMLYYISGSVQLIARIQLVWS